MHYPWWYVPGATAPMLIALVATVHVIVSHYAVGGGLFLAVETAYAHRTGDRPYLDYLKGHTRFFVLLTVVFGAITGVGIWWTIGLASPLATEFLIRTFVFGWAMEYVFFIIEIVSAFIFYYYWDRLAPRTHAMIGWIYGLSAWISLVLITGITAFMLNPGQWREGDSFWTAFLNPQFLPQTIARTGGALLLGSLYVFLHGALTIKDARLHGLIAKRSARPALVGAALVTLGGIGWLVYLPESSRAVLTRAAALNVLVALIFALTALVFVLLYLGPYRNPRWMSPLSAGVLLVLGIAAMGCGEFIRESVRKPYVLYNVVLGNQIYPGQVPRLRAEGYLEGGAWTKAYVQERWPQLLSGGKIDLKRALAPENARAVAMTAQDWIGLGEVLFQYHCNDCHAARAGYSAVAPLIRGRTHEMNLDMVKRLDAYHYFMPPWAGTDEEAEVLARYLDSIAPPRPRGMEPELTRAEANKETR